MRQGKHGPVPLIKYTRRLQNKFQRHLHGEGGFVLRPGRLPLMPRDGDVLLRGTIFCSGGLFMDVLERLVFVGPATDADALIERRTYKYHLAIQSGALAYNIFRYDSPHASPTEKGQPAYHYKHHKHCYDAAEKGIERKVVTFTSVDNTPTLYESLREAERWFYDHHELVRELNR